MVYTLTVLVVVVLTTTLCSGIPREDMLQFGAVQTDGFNSLERPLNMFGTLVELTQVTVDGLVRLYAGLSGPRALQFAGELLVSVPQPQQEEYTAYFRQVNSKDKSTLAKLALIVRYSVPGRRSVEFIPEYAAIWSWTRNSTHAHTFQAILVAQGSTTYLINNYCLDNEESGEEYPRFAVTDGDNHVVVLKERNILSAVRPSFVLGQEGATREGQYVLRFDALQCFNQDEFYCLEDQPKNFTTTNVTSRSAVLSFMETFDVGLATFKSPSITYNVTCMNAYDSTVLAASLNDTQEIKTIPLYNLRPYWEYSCRLVKTVCQNLQCTTRTIGLRFRTKEDVPEVPPSNITIANVTSTSAQVTWSPLPSKFQSGKIIYNLRLNSVHTSPHVIRVRGHSYQLVHLRPGTLFSLHIRASTRAGEGPASSVRQFMTPTAPSTETPSEPTSSATVNTTKTYSNTPSIHATDDTTPSSPTTVKGTTTQDPTVVEVDDLRVTTEPFTMSISVIVAIALGGAFLIAILVLVVVCVCICVYNYKHKRKTYTVNRTGTEL